MEQKRAADGEAAGCSSPGSWQFCAIFAEPYMKRAIPVLFSMQGKMAGKNGKNVYSAKHPFIMGALLLDIHFTMVPLAVETKHDDSGVCTHISDKSEDGGDGEAAEGATESESDGNSPHIYMVDGFEIKAYKLPPVVTTVSMRKTDDDEINDDEGMVQSDPPPTTKHGKHRDGCWCVVCTQHPNGNPHPQNCECRGCGIYLKRRETTLRRSINISLSGESASKRGRHKK